MLSDLFVSILFVAVAKEYNKFVVLTLFLITCYFLELFSLLPFGVLSLALFAGISIIRFCSQVLSGDSLLSLSFSILFGLFAYAGIVFIAYSFADGGIGKTFERFGVSLLKEIFDVILAIIILWFLNIGVGYINNVFFKKAYR